MTADGVASAILTEMGTCVPEAGLMLGVAGVCANKDGAASRQMKTNPNAFRICRI
jgi:hypothetical protein